MHYRESDDSYFTHNGKTYSLNTILSLTESRPFFELSVSDLVWVLKFTEIDEERVKAAKLDKSAPLLIYADPQFGLVPIDGAHRLKKALDTKKEKIFVRYVTDDDMKKALLVNRPSVRNQVYRKW